MKYLLMIYRDDQATAAMAPADMTRMRSKYDQATADMKASEVYVGGNALLPAATGTTVRVREGKIQTTDGPFAETKEQLGGYYLVECTDLDEAIRWAATIPHASECAIEVRPVMVMS